MNNEPINKTSDRGEKETDLKPESTRIKSN